jgi:hypothetical protein
LDDNIKMCLKIAFEAGRWLGQVDLEEHLDREQFSSCIYEALQSRKTTMPIKEGSTGRTIEYNLRSQKWRNGVKFEAEKLFKESFIVLKKILEDNKK